MIAPHADARAAALAALLSLDRVGHLDRAWDEIGLPQDPRDAALARELALGAVRWLRLYDALAARFLRQRPEPGLSWALRIGCHQLFALDRVPPSAAVDSSVSALRELGHAHATGIANAVLRRLADLRLDDRHDAGPLGRLAPDQQPIAAGVRASMPDLLLHELAPLLDGQPQRSLADLDRLPPLCLRALPGTTIPAHPAMLRQEGPWSWWEDPAEAIRLWVAPGLATVQDRAQGALADTLAGLGVLRPGRLVADWCAAPGGKSAALGEQHHRVIAADVPTRIRQVDARFVRLAHDGRKPALAPAFDAVVVDAPCSNTGTLARHPEARWRVTRQHLDQLAALQMGLLRGAAKAVRPEGILVYATCSLLPRENQGIAHRLDGWRILAEELRWPDGWRGGAYHVVLVRS